MKKQETESSSLREELSRLAGKDATLAYMLKMNRPLTRETYLAMEYPDGAPDPLPAELEEMIPEPLRAMTENGPETEDQAIHAESLRRSKVRRLFKAPPGRTPGSWDDGAPRRPGPCPVVGVAAPRPTART